MQIDNHYKYLEKVLQTIANNCEELKNKDIMWSIRAHGDKMYGYRDSWEESGVPFYHGAVIYLFSYLPPFSSTVRNTNKGWVPPCDWVIENYSKFKDLILKAEKLEGIKNEK